MMYGAWGQPPRIADSQTQAVVNNQMAMGAQQGLRRSSAGPGLARGRGQVALDQNRAGAARAAAQAQARGTQEADSLFNASIRSQFGMGAANERLQYDSLAEQERMSRWDSRFGNLTNAWGVLTGLLR